MLIRVLAICFTLSLSLSTQCEIFRDLWPPPHSSKNSSWVKLRGRSRLMELRSNVPHMVQWIKTQKLYLKPPLKKLLNFTGTALIDTHDENIKPKRTQNKTRVVSADFDDGGVFLPLIADFMFLALRVKVTEGMNLSFNDLWNSYLNGLAGKKPKRPKFVVDTINEFDLNYHEIYQIYVEDKTKKGVEHDLTSTYFDEAKWDVVRMQPLLKKKPHLSHNDKKALKNFKAINSRINSLLNKSQYEVLDVGYRIKDSGGSRGKVRYFYLASKDNQLFIFQAKFLSPSGAEIIADQPSHEQRILALANAYGYSQKHPPLFFEVIDGKRAGQFLVEMKTPDPLNVDKLPLKDRARWNQYLAQWLGYQASKQEQGFKMSSSIENDPQADLMADQLKNILNEYLQEVDLEQSR